MKKLLFFLTFFSITSIFSAAQVDAVLKNASAKEASSQALLNGALVLTRDIEFKEHGELIAFNSDGKFAVCYNYEKRKLILVDVPTGNLLWSRSVITSISSAKISKNDKFILINYFSGVLEVIDLKNGNLVHNFMNSSRLDQNDFSYDSKFVIQGGFTHAYLTDFNNRQTLLYTIPNISMVYIKVLDNRVITLDQAGKIIVTDLQGKIIKVIPALKKKFQDRIWAISDDGQFAVVGDYWDFLIVNLFTGEIIKEIDFRNYKEFDHDTGVSSITLSSDMRLMVIGTGDDTAKIIDLSSKKLLCIVHHKRKISTNSFRVTLSSDGRFVSTINHMEAKITDLKPYIKDPLQIQLINWIYTKKINSPQNPLIILNAEQTAVFASLDKNIQSALLNSYHVKMHGFKPNFVNAMEDPNCVTKIKLDDSTQSKQHILFHGINNLIQRILRDPKNKEFFLRIYAQEKVEHSNGNYIFLHGREWRWNFLSDIYKQLWNIIKNDVVKNYEFLRFGVPGKNRRGQDILFMNSAIFGNSTNSGSCTAHYWHNNSDMSSGLDNLCDVPQVFKTFKLEKMYKKHAAILKRLEELHKQCNKRGEILLISVPQNMLKHVICTQSGGGVRQARVDGKDTYDPKAVLDAVKDPKQTVECFDKLEWGLVLGTFDKQGNYTVNPDIDGPNKGISIYSFHDADEKMMHEYEKMRDEIFVKIKADLKDKSPVLKSKL